MRANFWVGISAGAVALLQCGTAQALDDKLIEAAKHEGSLTIYTSLVIDQLARPMAAAFEAKYGIKANYVRSDPNELIRRIIDEAKAGRPVADAFDGTNTAAILKRQGAIEPYVPEATANLPTNFFDPQGYWSGQYVLVTTPAVNTGLVAQGSAPKTLQDLLNPTWKGKMVWSGGPSNTGAAGFAGLAIREYGEEKAKQFLTELAKQNVATVPVTTAQVLDQVIAGEYAIGIMSAVHQVLFNASRGAPVEFLPINPAAESLEAVSLVRNALHPNAAKLYAEFVLSDEGQAVFRDNYYLPTSKRVPPKTPTALPDGQKWQAQFFSPDQLDSDLPKWEALISEVFR